MQDQIKSRFHSKVYVSSSVCKTTDDKKSDDHFNIVDIYFKLA